MRPCPMIPPARRAPLSPVHWMVFVSVGGSGGAILGVTWRAEHIEPLEHRHPCMPDWGPRNSVTCHSPFGGFIHSMLNKKSAILLGGAVIDDTWIRNHVQWWVGLDQPPSLANESMTNSKARNFMERSFIHGPHTCCLQPDSLQQCVVPSLAFCPEIRVVNDTQCQPRSLGCCVMSTGPPL